MELVQKTIGGCLKETAAKVGQQTAIEFGDWSCTWSELDEVTDLLAARFMSLYGIQKGTHVGIWSQNSPAFAQGVLALYKIGAVVVVLNAANSQDEMIDQLDRADVEVLFYGSGARGTIFDELIPQIRKKTPAKSACLCRKCTGIWKIFLLKLLHALSLPPEQRPGPNRSF